MFKNQLNGGISDMCESLYKGVPFRSWNGAARINGGLDIINAFMQYHNISIPIFIDNAESDNAVYPVDTQLIKMYVTKDVKLKMEVVK